MKILLKKAAIELGISKGKIKDMIKNKEILFELVNGAYYVDVDKVKEILSNQSSQKSINQDGKFEIYLIHLSKEFHKLYLQTGDDYFKRKYDLCQNILNGDDDFFTLAELKDLSIVQLDLNKKRIKRGLKDKETYKQIEIFEYYVGWFKKYHTDTLVFNTQYPHLYN